MTYAFGVNSLKISLQRSRRFYVDGDYQFGRVPRTLLLEGNLNAEAGVYAGGRKANKLLKSVIEHVFNTSRYMQCITQLHRCIEAAE